MHLRLAQVRNRSGDIAGAVDSIYAAAAAAAETGDEQLATACAEAARLTP